MKKITAIIGSENRRLTNYAVKEFEKQLKIFEDIDFEYVFLSDYQLDFCMSCCVCFCKGEEFCPKKDDRDKLIKKIEGSDGVIFASPNYAFGVSARMKNLFDRLAFIIHRPRYFDKAATAIVAQAIFGGKDILKYLHLAAGNLGFHVSKGCVVTAFYPVENAQKRKLEKSINAAAARFHKELYKTNPNPSFFRLMIFRLSRSGIRSIDKKMKDYKYYKEKGWLESEYYYPVKLGIIKSLFGKFFDFMGRKMSKRQ